jgi:hypothetical protein
MRSRLSDTLLGNKTKTVDLKTPSETGACGEKVWIRPNVAMRSRLSDTLLGNKNKTVDLKTSSETGPCGWD